MVSQAAVPHPSDVALLVEGQRSPARPTRARDRADQGHSEEIKEQVSQSSPLGLRPKGWAMCDPAMREMSRPVG